MVASDLLLSPLAAVLTAVLGFGLLAGVASVVRKRASEVTSAAEVSSGLGWSAFALIGLAAAATDFLVNIGLNPYHVPSHSDLIGKGAQMAVAEFVGVAVFGPLGGMLFRRKGSAVVGQIGGCLIGTSVCYWIVLALCHFGELVRDIPSLFQ